MPRASTRRQVLRAGGVAVASSVVFAGSVRAQSGELSVDVVHENGSRGTEVNALIIWQDNSQGSPYEMVVNYPTVGLPHTFTGLPAGHEYYVNAYMLDQLAGDIGWIPIDANDSSDRSIVVADPVWIRPRVLDSTGEPLAGATVEVRSHENDPNYTWRSADTNSEGYVDTPEGRLWLHPSDEGDGYYVVDVLYDEERVASERVEVLMRNRELQIATSAPVETTTATPTRTPTQTITRTSTATPTRTRTRTQTAAPTQVTTFSPPPGTGSPASFSAFINQVVITLLSIEGLVALATTLVIVLLIIVWEKRVDNP